MSTGLYNGYPGGKKPISVIFKEKLKTGLMGGIMVHTLSAFAHVPVFSYAPFLAFIRHRSMRVSLSLPQILRVRVVRARRVSASARAWASCTPR